MDNYEEMLNLNAEIRIQKPKFAFWDKYLINFFVASMPSTYKEIIDNLKIRNTLILDSIVYALYIKKIELTDLKIIKKKSVYFVTREGFRGGQKGQKKAEACTIAQTPNRGYAV